MRSCKYGHNSTKEGRLCGRDRPRVTRREVEGLKFAQLRKGQPAGALILLQLGLPRA